MNLAPQPSMLASLDALEQALHAERNALLDHDVDALLASTQAKLVALRQVEARALSHEVTGRVSALSELNRDNSVLLARRRREVSWALRHLGRLESAGVYDAGGQSSARPQVRSLGVG